MKNEPTSYRDPYWARLAEQAEKAYKLPAGLLVSILLNGERTDSGRTSSAGARTPFQIIPATRDKLIEKHGLDPWLNGRNAADGAAILLRESLDRNNNDPRAAVAEYHGGTSRGQWGPKTKSYVRRVVRGMPSQEDAAMRNVVNAYNDGSMDEESRTALERDVKSGVFKVPSGMTLSGENKYDKAVTLPQGVADAYANGSMDQESVAALERDMRAGLVRLPPSRVSQIPGGADWQPPTEQGIIQPRKEPTLAERMIGGLEATQTTATGMTSGAAGMVFGAIEGIGKSIIDGTFGTQEGVQTAMQQSELRGGQLTKMPISPEGQRQAAAVGDALAQAVPVTALTGELAGIAQGASAARPMAQAVAARGAEAVKDAVVPPVKQAVQDIARAPARAAEALGIRNPAPTSTSSGMASVGAAVTPEADARIAKAEGLPVPVELTRGAATRDAEQLAFEKEKMKDPELGGPLRERAESNNEQILQNLAQLGDDTEAVAIDMAETGDKVVAALVKGRDKDKADVNALYRKARSAPEANNPVDLNVTIDLGGEIGQTNLIDYMNNQMRGIESSKVPDEVRTVGLRMGVFKEDANGNLVSGNPTVKLMEEFRQEVSGMANPTQPKSIRQETIIKKLIDGATEPSAGPLFKEARAARAAMARKFENRAVVARLIENVRGKEDPKVSADMVFQRSIVNSSPKDIIHLRTVLNDIGPEGKQAWNEMKGALIRYIEDQTTNGLDSANRPIVSPAKLNQVVKKLDTNRKLDIVLGKQTAEIVRDLNDVVQYVNTTPPGTLVNNSGTAGMLRAAILETAGAGVLTGVPVPLLTALKQFKKIVQDNKIKTKIQHALDAKPQF